MNVQFRRICRKRTFLPRKVVPMETKNNNTTKQESEKHITLNKQHKSPATQYYLSKTTTATMTKKNTLRRTRKREICSKKKPVVCIRIHIHMLNDNTSRHQFIFAWLFVTGKMSQYQFSWLAIERNFKTNSAVRGCLLLTSYFLHFMCCFWFFAFHQQFNILYLESNDFVTPFCCMQQGKLLKMESFLFRLYSPLRSDSRCKNKWRYIAWRSLLISFHWMSNDVIHSIGCDSFCHIQRNLSNLSGENKKNSIFYRRLF